MPILVPESLPYGGDHDSTLVQSQQEWHFTPYVMDMLDREGPTSGPSALADAKVPQAGSEVAAPSEEDSD